jgi:hypothetical protein
VVLESFITEHIGFAPPILEASILAMKSVVKKNKRGGHEARQFKTDHPQPFMPQRVLLIKEGS